MEAVVVTLAILGIMGSSFKEPAKATRTRRAAKAPAPVLPVFRPPVVGPAPPPVAYQGTHVLPSHFRK